MADLLGGTTGQVLAKTSATDMDFTWTTPQVGDITGVTAGTGITGGGTSGTVTVTNDMATTITTAGDLIYGTGSGTYTRRGIGSTSQVLTVAGGVPTWATPAVSASGLTLITTQSFSTVSAVNLSDIFSTTYDHYKIIMSLTASTSSQITGRLRVSGADDTSANYDTQRLTGFNTTASAARVTSQTAWEISDYNGNQFAVDMMIYNPFRSIKTNAISQSTVESPPAYYLRSSLFQQTTSFTGFSVIAASGTISGTMSVWGYSK
jgi:hypothetical protein